MINISRLVSIHAYIQEEERLHPEATGEFTSLMHDLTLAMQMIAWEVRRAGLNDILGLTENINIHGEQVRKLDEYSNDLIRRAMDHGGHLCVMASEESDGMIKIPRKYKKGKYVLVYDPLDGSGNIDVNITIGTIFSIYKRIDVNSKRAGTLKDILQPGYKQVAAGYFMYGSSTTLVYTSGHGAHVFTYDPSIGKFIMTFENLKIPKWGGYFSTNMAYYHYWDKPMREYIEYLQTPGKSKRHPYQFRYIATSVADIHRTIHYGGIYLYPGNSIRPEGKIRLMYEANPLAFIIEQCGGRASTGFERILDIQPKSIHQKVPFIVGSYNDVLEYEMFLKGEHPFQKKKNK
jgi:fructose-1,6-bisphosphatase I